MQVLLREPSNRSQANPHVHIPELDGIRGIAVTLILVEHFWPTTGFWEAARPLAGIGWIGVDLFFVLSGFLITGILVDTMSSPNYYWRFYSRRAFRVFPLYYSFLIVTFTFLAVWHGGREFVALKTRWGSPIWFFCYLANFISSAKGTFPPFAPLGPPWSLQIEEQFYLIFPFLLRWLRHHLISFLLFISVLSLVFRSAMFFLTPGDALIQYLGTVSRFDALSLGGLAAVLSRRKDNSRIYKHVVLLFNASALLLACHYFLDGTAAGAPVTRTLGYSVNALMFASFMFLVVKNRGARITSPLRFGPLCGLGKISYGVYLLQLPIQSLIKLLTGSALMGTMTRTPLFSGVSVTLTVTVAWFSWKYFERPVQQWGYGLRFISLRGSGPL